MATSRRTLLAALAVANIAVFYQYFLKWLIFDVNGVSRVMQPLSDFPYNCRRINDHNLAACEDAWIDEKSRQIFLACSNVLGRKAWNPNIGHWAAERRSRTDHVVAMSLDTPNPQDSGSFDYRVLSLGDYTNHFDEPELSLVGMSGVTQRDGTVHLYFVNAAPTYNVTSNSIAQQDVTGANATIEAFSLAPQGDTLKHLHTFYNPSHLHTPNRPAPRPDGSIYFTNDHGPHKAGLNMALSPLLGTGTIAHCLPPTKRGAQSECVTVGGKHRFPNGLHYSVRDDLLYVPTSGGADIVVYRPSLPATPQTKAASPLKTLQGSALTKIATIPCGYPLDNISEDADGNLLVAAFPKVSAMMDLAKFSTPIDGRGAPTLTLKITKDPAKMHLPKEQWAWKVEKLVEDDTAEKLPTATTTVRDAKTGRLFVVGINSPWIAVCEPQ